MAYPGLTFAILVGIAIGTAFYYYFNQEDNQQQRQQGYHYPGRDDTSDIDYDAWSSSRSTSSSGSRRRRRNSTNKCSICLDDLNRGNIKKLVECGHEFHEHCLTIWIRQNKTCPNCRRAVFF